MLDEKKVHLMSKVALYEQTQEREALKINKRIHEDLKKPSLFNALPIAIITFFLAAAVFTAAAYGWITEIYQSLGLIRFAILFVIVLILFVLLYCIYARHINLKKYERLRGELWKYDFYRKKLEGILNDDISDVERGAS